MSSRVMLTRTPHHDEACRDTMVKTSCGASREQLPPRNTALLTSARLPWPFLALKHSAELFAVPPVSAQALFASSVAPARSTSLVLYFGPV